MPKLSKKKILVSCLTVLIITITVFTYFHAQKEREKQQSKALLGRLTEAANLMEPVRDKMPDERKN